MLYLPGSQLEDIEAQIRLSFREEHENTRLLVSRHAYKLQQELVDNQQRMSRLRAAIELQWEKICRDAR